MCDEFFVTDVIANQGFSFIISLIGNSLKCFKGGLIFDTSRPSREQMVKEPELKECHRGFLEHRNSQKSVCNIWQRFSCLLDEGIPKIWKKLNSDSGFLRADQGRAKMCCQMGWIGCAVLQVAQKAIMRIKFLSYFWISPYQVDLKNVVKSFKHFFGYFNTVETHSTM